MLDRRPSERIILFSAFVDEIVRSEAEAAGMSTSLERSRLSELPEVVFSLASSN